MKVIRMFVLAGIPSLVWAQDRPPVKADAGHEPRIAKQVRESGTEAGPDNLLSQSEILNAGDLATLVPKTALLHLPANLRGVLGISSGSRIVEWREFFRSNRSWIEMIEVTPGQAGGREPLPAADLERFKSSRRLIIATLQGRPVSILPPGGAKPEIAVSNNSPKP